MKSWLIRFGGLRRFSLGQDTLYLPRFTGTGMLGQDTLKYIRVSLGFFIPEKSRSCPNMPVPVKLTAVVRQVKSKNIVARMKHAPPFHTGFQSRSKSQAGHKDGGGIVFLKKWVRTGVIEFNHFKS